MTGTSKQRKKTSKLQLITNKNEYLGILREYRCFGGVILLLLLKGFFLWFYFISPYNIFLRLTLIILTLGAVTYLLLTRFKKSRLCLASFVLLGAFFLITPVSWDDRLAVVRYGMQVEYLPHSLGIENNTQSVGLRAGEMVEIQRGQVPKQELYTFSIFDDDACHLEIVNISPNFMLRYEVCPSGAGNLWISKFFLRYW